MAKKTEIPTFQLGHTGMGSYAFRWAISLSKGSFDVLSFIEKSNEIGSKTVQICENLPLDKHGSAELKQISDRIQEYGMVTELGISGSQPEKLKKFIAIASELDAGILRVVLVDDAFKPTFEEVKENFRALLPLQEKTGVRIAIENHFHFTPPELVEILQEIGSPLTGICLDPFNSILRFSGVKETIDLLAPYAISVHVKDAQINRHGTGFMVTGCPQGEGQLDLEYMLRALGRNGHRPNLYVESWMEEIAEPAETIRQEEAWSTHALVKINQCIERIRTGV